MSVETYPSRELTAQRELRLAVGRQLTRTVLFCALALLCGVAIGSYFVRQQMQLQQGLVGQLQREIRGLTGDIQRLELEHSRSIAKFDAATERIERNHQIALAGELQHNQHRLGGLERTIDRQQSQLKTDYDALTAELEPYQALHLAVPADLVVESIERLVASRTADLQRLLDEVRAQVNHDRVRYAALQGRWLVGEDNLRPAETPTLSQPLVAFDALAGNEARLPTAGVDPAPSASAGSDVGGESLDVGRTQQVSASSENATGSPQPSASTARRPLVGGPGRRRPYYQLLSFGSGRVVTPLKPVVPPSQVAETDEPWESAGQTSNTTLR